MKPGTFFPAQTYPQKFSSGGADAIPEPAVMCIGVVPTEKRPPNSKPECTIYWMTCHLDGRIEFDETLFHGDARNVAATNLDWAIEPD